MCIRDSSKADGSEEIVQNKCIRDTLRQGGEQGSPSTYEIVQEAICVQGSKSHGE